MKRLLLAALCVFGIGQQRADADISSAFYGALIVYATNGHCLHVQQGWQFQATYHPFQDVAGDKFTGLQITWVMQPQLYRINADLTPAFQNAQMLYGEPGWYVPPPGIAISMQQRVPATVAPNTANLNMRIQIKNWIGDPGKNGQPCIAALRGNFFRASRAPQQKGRRKGGL